MSAPSRHGLLALAALLGACDEGLTSAPPEPAPARVEIDDAPAESTPAPATAEIESAATGDPLPTSSWWRDATVTDDAFARRVLYSWIPATTADRLRRERELFDDAQLPEGPTAYVQRMEHVAARTDTSGALARLLLGHPDLARRRYAWVRPWATRMGIVRPYGDRLIEVVLRPDAIVGRFDPSRDEPWEFRDLDERPVPLARVLADPSRIGAILHVRSDGEPHFREYVLCNPSAIATWSLAAPSITATIAEDASALRELVTHSEAGAPDAYADILAFTVDHYAATPANLVAIAEALEASAQPGKPLRVTPRDRFRPDAVPGLVHVRDVPPRFVNVV